MPPKPSTDAAAACAHNEPFCTLIREKLQVAELAAQRNPSLQHMPLTYKRALLRYSTHPSKTRLSYDNASVCSLIAAPNPLRSFADFTALQYVGSATATSCMQKAKQLGLCDDDGPSSAAAPAPKKRSREKGATAGGDGMRQLAIDGGVVVEAKASRLYKPKPGSAQEAVLRALFAAEEHSEDGLFRDDMLQRAQVFTGGATSTSQPRHPPLTLPCRHHPAKRAPRLELDKIFIN